MAKVKNWAYPLDSIGKPTPSKKAIKSAWSPLAPSPAQQLDDLMSDYQNQGLNGIYVGNPPPPITQNIVTSVGGAGPMYVSTGSCTSSYNNIFNKPAPWPKFFEEPVQDEWSPAPPPIKTIPPKPVPGRLYPVINTGARVEKKVSRKFFVYVDGLNMWSKEQNNIIKLLTEAEGFDAIEDKIELQGAHTPEWYYVVKELHD